MNAKKTVTVILLLFVVAGVGTMVMKVLRTNKISYSAARNKQSSETQPQSAGTEKTSETTDSNELVQPDANVDVVYYFMTTQRCQNCMKIESFTKEAVHERYADKLQNNKMFWKMINLDEPQNNHFIKDYELFTKSVVLVRYRDGKQVEWKNLDQVWNFLGDKAAFKNYVIREVDAFFGEG
ncbi:MAG: hypothetical protein JXB48_19070 [Candidatus Latescibacteria bacterium]|nr:hypothetical protein [Candidatus Latescibacterota bacterium]